MHVAIADTSLLPRRAVAIDGAHGRRGQSPAQESLWHQLDACADRHADRVAVSDGHYSWTYAELRARAESLAAEVPEAPQSATTLIATFFHTGAPAIAAMLSAWRSGRPFIALDPKHPDPFLRSQAARLGVTQFIAPPDLLDRARAIAPAHTHVLSFDPAAAPRPARSAPLPFLTDPLTPACILSTSGSTGEPKAAIKTHAGLLLSARHYIDGASATPEDRFLLLAPVGFMASIPPILCSLLTGASLHPFNPAAHGVDALAAFIRGHQISVYHSVPTLLRRLAHVEGAPAMLRSVRLVRLAGEPVRPSDVRLVRRLFTRPAPLQILMGAAETSLISQHLIAPTDPIPDTLIPVGAIAPGVDISIVDERGRPVPCGQPGRLIVRGRTISPGYWNSPAATVDAFTQDHCDPARWTFRTSDSCRLRDDGVLELLGRTGEFIKVNGVRISPAAVEAALVELPGVREAAVVGAANERGEERAVAYVAPKPGVRLTPGPLRHGLRALLPGSMIPSQFVVIEALPLTASGKVDRHALPAPPRHVRPAWRRPRDDVECQVAMAWEHALGVENVGLDDRFADLGGTSIEALSVLLHLERVMCRPIPDAAMMLHDCVEGVATAVARENVPHAILVPLKASGTKRPFFCVHAGLGTVGGFGPLAGALDPDRSVYALQSAGIHDAEEWPLTTIDAMAERYLREIEAVDPAGPYLLGGVCMGGLVAWEMARRITASGREVAHLSLIETYAPGPRPERTLSNRIAFAARHALRALRWRATRAACHLWGGALPPALLPGWRQFVHYNNGAASRRYSGRRYAGPVSIFAGRDHPPFPGRDLRSAMALLADGPVDVVHVPGHHHNICNGAHIRELAGALRTALDAAESRVFTGPR